MEDGAYRRVTRFIPIGEHAPRLGSERRHGHRVGGGRRVGFGRLRRLLQVRACLSDTLPRVLQLRLALCRRTQLAQDLLELVLER